ncbi:MAG: hypothetical protein IJ055_08015 [Oscillospiraceae bacterium]|nr:hypothetical protein [Oscillospiraceae bacterium]
MPDRETITASALALTLGVPVWCWVCLPAPRPVQVLCLTALSMLLLLPALLQRYLLLRLGVRNLFLQYLVSVVLSAAAGIGVWCAVSRMLPLFQAAAAAVLAGLTLRTACLLVRSQSLLSVNFIAAAGTLYFLSWVLCRLQGHVLPSWCLWVLGVQMALYAAMRTRQSLRRAANVAPSADCRLHNAGMLLACIVLCTAVMLCGGPFVEGLRRALVTAGNTLAQFLRWLLLLLFGKALLSPEDETLEQNTAPETGEVMAWVGMLTTVLTVGAACVLVWKFRHELLDFLSSVRYHLFLTIRALLRRREPEQTALRGGEYTDSVELLTSQTAARPQKGEESFRKRLRRFRREKDPCVQYRMGYALWLWALGQWELSYAPSDPPEAIREKVQGAPDPELTEQVTRDYYLVRYAELPPTPEMLERMKALVERTAKGM